MLSRHSVGTYLWNKLTYNSSANTQPQLSQLAEPLRTDSGWNSGIGAWELISTVEKKKRKKEKSTGGDWFTENLPPSWKSPCCLISCLFLLHPVHVNPLPVPLEITSIISKVYPACPTMFALQAMFHKNCSYSIRNVAETHKQCVSENDCRNLSLALFFFSAYAKPDRLAICLQKKKFESFTEGSAHWTKQFSIHWSKVWCIYAKQRKVSWLINAKSHLDCYNDDYTHMWNNFTKFALDRIWTCKEKQLFDLSATTVILIIWPWPLKLVWERKHLI